MPPESPIVASPGRGFSGFGLALAGLMLFVLFAAQVAGSVLPLRLLQPAWQVRVSAALISSAPIALIGLALHQIAIDLGNPDNRLRSRHRLFSQLALLAAIGFLLLIPLQGSAILRQGSAVQQAQILRIANAEKRLEALRQSVVVATSSADLNRRLQELNGPVLGPADAAQPLPLLKAQVDAVLDQAALQIRRERQSNPPLKRHALLPDLLRSAISSLALAVAFAALGRRPGSHRSPLQELQSSLERRSRYQETRRYKPNLLEDLVDRLLERFRR